MFDAVLCLEVLEHLSKHEGSVLIEQLEQIAVKRIILTTPAVFLKQEPFGGNPWQKHKTFWTPHELENRSCKVAGFGLRFLFVRNSERVLGITALIAFLVSLVFSPLVYFMPQQLAYETSAYKSLIPLSRNKVIE